MFLTSLSGKMERGRRVPLTATGTNPGSECTLYLRFYVCETCPQQFEGNTFSVHRTIKLKADLQYQISSHSHQLSKVTALKRRMSESSMLMLVPTSEWSSSGSRADHWVSASLGAEGWAAG